MRDLLITVPHHAATVPLEILAEMLAGDVHDDVTRLGRLERLRREGDPSTDDLFRLPGARFVTATVSRFVVDLNRGRDDVGPNGVVKSTDFARRPLYPPGGEPDADRIAARLLRYYDPFHAQVRREVERRPPLAIVDAHSMAADGPVLGPDAGRPRPAAQLITGGGPDGEPVDGPVSLPGAAARALAAALEAALAARLPLGRDGEPHGVRINDPFAHGEIQRRYGASGEASDVPTVSIEIHRGLFEDSDARPRPERIARVREAIGEALQVVRPHLEGAASRS